MWLGLLACGYTIIFIKNLTTPHEREQNIILLFQKNESRFKIRNITQFVSWRIMALTGEIKTKIFKD